MKKTIISYILNAALVLLSLCFSLVIVEISLPFLKIRTIEEAVYQVKRPVVQYIYGQYNPTLRYTLKTNLHNIRIHYSNQLDYTIDTNKYGFRGEDWDISPQRKNIIILGDSFAFGWGVQRKEMIGKHLEKELKQLDPSYQVINLAIPGYSINEIIACLELYRNLLKPVASVYIFCPNDLDGISEPIFPGIYDIEYKPRPDDEKLFQEMIERNQPGYWSLNRFYRGSYCKAFHARVIRPLFSKRIRKSLSIDPAPDGYDFPPPIETANNCSDSPKAKFLASCLKRLHGDLLSRNFYILNTSDKYTLFKYDQPNSIRWSLKKISLETPNMYFIDFETFARKTPGSRNYYLDYDDHWSAQGHAAAAGLLLEKMKSTLPNIANKTAQLSPTDLRPVQ